VAYSPGERKGGALAKGGDVLKERKQTRLLWERREVSLLTPKGVEKRDCRKPRENSLGGGLFLNRGDRRPLQKERFTKRPYLLVAMEKFSFNPKGFEGGGGSRGSWHGGRVPRYSSRCVR